MAGLPVPITETGRFSMSVLFAPISAIAALTSLIVDPSVALSGLRRMSSQPTGAMKELKGLLGFSVRGEGGQMVFREGAVYEGSLVGESGGHEFIIYLKLRRGVIDYWRKRQV